MPHNANIQVNSSRNTIWAYHLWDDGKTLISTFKYTKKIVGIPNDLESFQFNFLLKTIWQDECSESLSMIEKKK